MTLLLSSLWPGLAAALLLGLAIGWSCGTPRGRAVPLGLAALSLSLIGLAAAGAVPGLAGLWTESAALLLLAYTSACALGGAGRSLRRASVPWADDAAALAQPRDGSDR